MSSPPIVTEWRGLEFEQPFRRAREAIKIIRQVVDGNTVEYHGKVSNVGPYSVGADGPLDEISIFNAAMGERTLRLTGEFVDGWMPVFTLLSKDGVPVRSPHLPRVWLERTAYKYLE